MGNEGKLLLIVPQDMAEKTIDIIKKQKYGVNVKNIGIMTDRADVILKTKIGGRRIIPPLSGEGLPRIC